MLVSFKWLRSDDRILNSVNSLTTSRLFVEIENLTDELWRKRNDFKLIFLFQFGFGGGNNPASNVGGLLGGSPVRQVGGLAAGAANTAANVGGRVADSLKGLIESKIFSFKSKFFRFC